MFRGLKTLNATNTPTNITGVGSSWFSTATFWGFKSFTAGVPINNTNTIYLGIVSGEMPIIISTGSYFSWTLQANQKESLSNFWFQGQSGDGVYFVTY